MSATLSNVVGTVCLLIGIASVVSHLFFKGKLTVISLPVAVIVIALSLLLLVRNARMRGTSSGKDPVS